MLVYIHIPFCAHKCHYCDFNSHVRRNPEWERYGNALVRELEWQLAQPQWQHRRVNTIYFGGGTPSLAPPSLIKKVVTALQNRIEWSDAVEISIEANPGSIDAAKLEGWHQAGVNRLSIGVQSLDNGQLHWLERIHTAQQALDAVALAQTGGWDNIGLDLIYGLPDHSDRNRAEGWQQI
ncbi:MAG: radical SAM protein, partial [Mariprofundales bacterium]|nr:radical SAM protein [Mariprofundales bacterium]